MADIAHISESGLHWTQSSSGETYLCPAGISTASSDAELAQACVVESENPQND